MRYIQLAGGVVRVWVLPAVMGLMGGIHVLKVLNDGIHVLKVINDGIHVLKVGEGVWDNRLHLSCMILNRKAE